MEDDLALATRELLSPAQRAQMLCIPDDLSDQLLARYYTFSDDDLALIKQRRRPKNRLGFAVQLAYLHFPGRTWLVSEEVPPRVLAYVADQLRVNPMSLVQYAQDREATRFEHLAELQHVSGFRSFSAQTYRWRTSISAMARNLASASILIFLINMARTVSR
jgi:TnpA family transposase